MPTIAPNPYMYDAAIRDPSRFFGRSRMLGFVEQTILRDECVSIVGMAKSGLSSLLNRLAAPDLTARCQLPGREVLIIPIDCREYVDPLDFIMCMLAKIAPDRPLPRVPNWRPAFGRLLSTARHMRNKKLVILLDDFEPMGASDLYVEFIESFRGLAIDADITLVTTTHTELHRCCHKKVSTSPFPNIFKVRYLGAFDENEVRLFIQDTSKKSGVSLEPYTDRILESSGGMPYLVQMACWHYYEAISTGTAIDAEKIASNLAEGAGDALEQAWSSLDRGDKNVMGALATGQFKGQIPSSLVHKGYVVGDRVFAPAFVDRIRAHL